MPPLYANGSRPASTCKTIACVSRGLPRIRGNGPSRRSAGDPGRARRLTLWHRDGVSTDAVGAAFQRFVDALNHPRDAKALRAAVTDDVRIDRHGPGERGTAPVAETFTGIAEVARWLARMPPVIAFAPAGAGWSDGADTWAIEYQYATHDGAFRNGGIWVARLAEDGRIAFLSHHPFALRDDR